MKFLNQGFDHIEWSVSDVSSHAPLYKKMGFEKIGERRLPNKGSHSELWAQGGLRVLLTQYDTHSTDEGARFLKNHGDGIAVVALEVEDAAKAFHETTSRGARPALKPTRFESPQGSVVRAEVFTPADGRFAFIERKSPADASKPALFDEELIVARMQSPSPSGICGIDHLTSNISIGDTAQWVEYYTQAFGFKIVRHFDIRTGRTGLTSEVVQSSDGKIKIPINEATEPESQVQEFVTRFNGVGVQHVAFQTTGIISTLRKLRGEGFKFLSVPHTYYEAIPGRVPGIKEDLSVLEELGILVDGESGHGYLMQIFTQELIGPFFYEVIERKGDDGFGEGNFRALFEAIERDQIQRGVLRA